MKFKLLILSMISDLVILAMAIVSFIYGPNFMKVLWVLGICYHVYRFRLDCWRPKAIKEAMKNMKEKGL